MFSRHIVSGIVISGSIALSGPVFAQTTTVDTAAITTSCSVSAESCMVAVQAALKALEALGLTPAAFNLELGVLAAAVVSAGESLPPAQRVSFSSVVKEIALSAKNPAQREALLQMAVSISSDDAGGGAALPVDTTALSTN